MPAWNVQLILTSPLTRAMQTACIAFAAVEAPMIAWPILTEFYPEVFPSS